MGNNGHAGEGLRLIREWIQAGAIGPVREIHCWTDRPGNWWTQTGDAADRIVRRSGQLDWDLWLGSAPVRPYSPAYCPVGWRAWFDFGNGALGDMAMHNLDPAFYALDLDAPVAVEARTSALGEETYPAWQIITFRVRRAAARNRR